MKLQVNIGIKSILIFIDPFCDQVAQIIDRVDKFMEASNFRIIYIKLIAQLIKLKTPKNQSNFMSQINRYSRICS